jgi:hypothetical protein
MSTEENQTQDQTPAQSPADALAALAAAQATPTPAVVAQGVQEVVAPVVTEVKPTAAEVKQTKVKEVEVAQADGFDPMSIPAVAKALRPVPEAFRLPIVALKDYFKEMAPGKPVDPGRGGVLSTQLLRTITNVINRNEEHFQPLFTALLRLFEAHADGALGEAYVFRFVPHMQASDDERRAFTQLVNLIKVLGPAQGRKEAMKQVDIPRSLRYSLTDAGRDRVMNYFGA